MDRKEFLQMTLGAMVASAVLSLSPASDAQVAPPLADTPLYEVTPQSAVDVSDEVTLEVWVLPAGTGGGHLFDKHYQERAWYSPMDGFALTLSPDGKLRFEMAKAEECSAAVLLPMDRPTYLAAVYSSPRKIMKLYVDGQEAGSTDKGGFPKIAKSTAPVRVGSDQFGGDRFLGQLLRAAIHSRALSAEEIRQRNTASPALSGIIGDWPLGDWTLTGAVPRTITPTAGKVMLTRAPRLIQLSGQAHAPTEPLSLWYRQPAQPWVEALAIGNGRLGAMVFGGIERERLQLNEDSFWSGQPYDPANADALQHLPEVRRLIFDRNYKAAEDLIQTKMRGRPPGQSSYQPVGDLVLDFPGVTTAQNYRRELNIDTAIASVSYTHDGVEFRRELLSSPVAGVIALRLTASRPGCITFSAALRTPQNGNTIVDQGDTLILKAVGPTGRNDVSGKLQMECYARIVPRGGRLMTEGDTLTLSGADSAIVLVDAGTSYNNFRDISADPSVGPKTRIARAAKTSWDILRAAHVKEHQRLFRRMSFDLGTGIGAQQPTDSRLLAFANGADDPQLVPLYFQFGRYLLISSSRPGTQPANLQGLWNQGIVPPWDSKYTININTEMNYWPAEPTNLSELAEPLFRMVKDLSETGRHTAKRHYAAGGWMAHHNTDLWRATEEIDGAFWGTWQMGGAWLCTHLWEHFQYTKDKEFLTEFYPVMKEAAQFFVDTLIEEPTHKWLVVSPSTSPEHEHPFGTSICAGTTMDASLLRDLFEQTARTAQMLGRDDAFRKKLLEARLRLVPFQIGKAGQLQEWMEDWDMEAPELTHRHLSHLYGLFPSNQISPRETPALAAAAAKSLNIRGDIAEGWALAWRINCWARLHEGERSYQILKDLLAPTHTYLNLFDAHPPFQIDGNFGGVSGITEMLLQSHMDEIELLPALPMAWPCGSIKGLRARGGFQVDQQWQGGRLTRVTIRSDGGTSPKLRYGEKTVELRLKENAEVHLDGQLHLAAPLGD